jgi:carbonic anhydrase
LGSLEYATAVAGSKLILVLGHTNCGAIKGACDNVKLGNLTDLLDKIQPAVNAETKHKDNRNSSNLAFVDEVAKLNATHTVEEILKQSDIIRSLVDEGKIGIVAAMYDITTGKVNFFDKLGMPLASADSETSAQLA